MSDKTVIFKSGLGRTFDVRVIENVKSRSPQARQQIIKDIQGITKKAWADPGELAEKWLRFSDIVLFAYEQNDPCGFALGCYIDEDILFLPATVTVSKAQNRGLAVFLNGYLIRNFFLHIASTGKRNSNKITDPFYIVFWTPNPLLYYMVSRHVELFPSPGRNMPTDKEKEVVGRAINVYSPKSNFDWDNFVDVGCDLTHAGLLYGKHEIPWCRDKKINEFFESKLELTKQKGNNFIVTGKITLEDLLFKRV